MTDDRDVGPQAGPRGRFVTPDDIVDATDLSREQKIDLLRQWEQDLRQHTTREGMMPPAAVQVPETLRSVRAMLRILEGSGP